MNMLQYNYGTGPNEIIKTNIKTIENALDKLYYHMELNIMTFELNLKNKNRIHSTRS
jgi:hypothetical protein